MSLKGTICYLIKIEDQTFLCVLDQTNGAFHRFPLTHLDAARLAYECAGYVNSELGGYTRMFGNETPPDTGSA